MGNAMKLWEFFNGKKSVIGGSALYLAWFLSDFVIGQMHVTAEWVPTSVAFLEWVGGILFPTGLAHKAVKAKVASNG